MPEIKGRCNEPGPWGAACTDWPLHRYSCHDAGKDVSWQPDWREDTPPEGGGSYIEEPEDEPSDCTCTEAFGQLHHSGCPKHERCPETMRGIPIQCVLTAGHKGDHK